MIKPEYVVKLLSENMKTN
nr:F420H2:quinone oxidoreductase complex, F420H2:2,3-dimethyl-1,4-naphthoquinone oxidoreductase=33 kda polypeptide {N-terminal} {EC 1.6.5.-} [Archaeoglobus fulgidus, VC-16, DSM 4304, Peptide Partial, 18 aa] [Archaeoglobus fulgidus]